jgi:competence protein ComEC
MGAFNEVSLIGPLVNCIAVPIVGFAILPLGLTLTAIGAAAPGISIPGFAICGHGVDGVIEILKWASNLSFSAVLTPVPTPLETGLYYGLLGLVFFSKTFPRFRSMVVGWVLVALLDAAYWGHERFWHQDLRITAIDVGQGTSNLIEFPGGRVMLVDGGGFSSNQMFDLGARVVAPVLRRKKILTVDFVVLSHPNADHLNGLYWILDRFRVGCLWTNGERADTLSYRQFFQCVVDRGIPIETVHRQSPRTVFSTAEVRILHPPPDAIVQDGKPDGKTIDDHSIILKIQFNGVSVLLPGDIRESAERQLVADLGPDALNSDILMVPHHGSRFSSSMPFIRRVSPRVAIISAGWRNRFGFPHSEVVDRYHRAGSRLFRTDRDGAVGIRIEDNRVRVRAEGSNRFYIWRPAIDLMGSIDRTRLF